MPKQYYAINTIDWSLNKAALQLIRRQVFIEEQSVPEDEEWDSLDKTALHFLVTTEQHQPVACARLVINNRVGKIGRLAVLLPYRKKGVGRQLMQHILAHVNHYPLDQLALDAQLHAIAFYELLGFQACGEVFMDAGIAHRKMVKSLIPQSRD